MNRVAEKSLICTFAALALLAAEANAQTASTLYGVTGNGGAPSETLFVLDKNDASSTFVMTLGHGSDGEEIAFNPDDGLLYHASGRDGGRVFETIHPGTLAITDIPLSGDPLDEVSGLTYEGAGVFLASHRLGGISTLTSGGVGTNIGSTGAALTGLTYVGSTLYAVGKSDDLLRTIDPLTGSTLTSVSISLAGETVSGANGLATDPVDDSLWAILKTEPGFPTFPAERALVTVDPGTGVATLVGITDVTGIAGIAFVGGDGFTVTPSVGTGMGTISPSNPVEVISGLTTSFTLTPDSGFVIDSVGGTCGGTLVGETFTTEPVTADCTVIANFVPEPTTILYGVTGDGGFPAETLFRLDMSNASSTFVLTLGSGTDGEEIAFNRDDGLMYHVSGHRTGGGVQAFESIDLDTLAVTPINISGANFEEASALTYAGQGDFALGDRGGALLEITTGGSVSSSGTTDTILTGLAYIGTTLYAVGRNDNLLRTVDPVTGNTLGSVSMTMPGFTLNGATGLAANPDDNTLWGILKIDALAPGDRALATIDPATGVATYIGTTDVTGMAGIAFAFIPCDPCEVTPAVGGGAGTLSPPTVQNVPYGDTTAFTLSPAVGNHIDFVDSTCGGSLSGGAFTTAPIYTHCEVVGYFEINTYALTYTPGAGGEISGDTSQAVDHGMDGTEVTAVPNANYHFVDWSDGVLTAARTDTNVMSDITVTANFAIDTYTVNSSVGTGLGTISPPGNQEIDHGATAQFTLTPDTGYHIDSVGGTCGGSLVGSTYTTNPVTAACTVVANFAIDTFTLSYTAGPNGSISGTSPQIVEYGMDGAQVTAVPNANHHFVDWSDGVMTASRTDTNVMADISVTANFAIDTFTVTSSVGTGLGTISPPGNQEIDHGATAQFTLTPNTGYHIDSVGGTCGGSLVGNTYTTGPITADCTVVANFLINTYTVTSSVGTGLGTINPPGNQQINHGDTAQFALTPDTGYHIDSVDGSCGGSLVGSTYTTDPITDDCTVVANFAIDTFTLSYTAGANGSISGTSPQIVEYGMDGTQVTAVPDANHHFVDWSDGVMTASRTDTNVMADISVTANFAIDTYTVTSSVGSGLGSISPLGDQTIDHGDTAQFMLSPDTGYHIDSVGGTCGGSRTGNTYTTNPVTAACTVVANFAIDTFTLSYTAGANGSISGTSPQTVEYGMDGTQVTAVPDANYHFVDWSDGVMTASRTDTNVMADLSVTANFAIDTYTVTSSVSSGLGSISPLGDQTIDHGDTAQFTLTPDTGYHIDSVGGTCGGSLVGSTYTTNPVTDDCTVVANFAIDTFTLTYTAGPNGSISGTSPQTVDYGTDGTEVTAVPEANYVFVEWSDGVMTATRTDTNVMADLSVTASFAPDTSTVTSSVGTPAGSIDPLGDQEIDAGETTEFTLTPDPNYHIDSLGGTCGGSLNGNVFTTDPVTADCTVVANFAIDTHTVTSSVGAGNGTIAPLGDQEIDHDSTPQFSLNPGSGHLVDSVGGTCGGTLNGNTYTTAPITADCTVVANFILDADVIIVDGFE